jgi:hypothetical protein
LCLLCLGLALLLGPTAVFAQKASDENPKLDLNEVSESGTYGELTEEQRQQFREQILKKVTQLTKYISTIANKDKVQSERRAAIDNAVDLFLDEDRIVEISNLNNPYLKRPKIRQYLEKLYRYPAARVEVTFYEVAHVSKIERGPDGNFYATAQVYQLFRSYNREGITIYADKTVKKINIIIERKKTIVGDQTETEYVIKLGNIKVNETKEAK